MADKKKSLPIIKVCVGECCAARKGKKVAKRIREALEAESGAIKIAVKKSDCLGKCKEGPIVRCSQAKATYNHVKPRDVQEIISEIRRAVTD